MASEATRRLSLHAWHEERGARFVEDRGLLVPADYGEPEVERDALWKGCSLADGSAADRLELVGEDRVRFLNGLVTCDLALLEAGQGTYGFFTDRKGGVLADVTALMLEDRLWLRLPTGTGPSIQEHLERYIIADRVEVRPLEDLVILLLLGPAARQTVGPSAPTAGLGHGRGEVFGSEVERVREPHFPGFSLWVSASLAAQLASDLVARGGAVPVGSGVTEAWRIVTGFPRFDVDYPAASLPQEAAVEGVVSYDKGCYLGQEVVARLHYRGQAARRVCRLLFENGVEPAPGTPLLLEGREVGRVTSSARDPEQDRPVGLGLVARRGAQEGLDLELEDGRRATVRLDVPRETPTA